MKKKNKRKKLKIIIVFILIFAILGYFITEVDVDVGNPQSNPTEPTETILNGVSNDIQIQLEKSNLYIQSNYDNGYEYGSGVIFDYDDTHYYAITNYHVIDGNDHIINSSFVKTFDNISSDFEILSYDNNKDLAIIKFDKSTREDITPLSIIVNTAQVNDLILAVGNPSGEIATLTYGFINRITTLQELELEHEVYEHNAPLYNGSSGGALVDMDGNIIGINTWTLNGNNYAIKSSVIYEFILNNL